MNQPTNFRPAGPSTRCTGSALARSADAEPVELAGVGDALAEAPRTITDVPCSKKRPTGWPPWAYRPATLAGVTGRTRSGRTGCAGWPYAEVPAHLRPRPALQLVEQHPYRAQGRPMRAGGVGQRVHLVEHRAHLGHGHDERGRLLTNPGLLLEEAPGLHQEPADVIAGETIACQRPPHDLQVPTAERPPVRTATVSDYRSAHRGGGMSAM
jgi:hypothetical protein